MPKFLCQKKFWPKNPKKIGFIFIESKFSYYPLQFFHESMRYDYRNTQVPISNQNFYAKKSFAQKTFKILVFCQQSQSFYIAQSNLYMNQFVMITGTHTYQFQAKIVMSKKVIAKKLFNFYCFCTSFVNRVKVFILPTPIYT